MEWDGERRKEEGIQRANDHASEAWKQRMDEALRTFPCGSRITSENLTALAGQPPGHPSAVGARVNALARRGLLRPTNEFVKAQRANQHSAKLAVWVVC